MHMLTKYGYTCDEVEKSGWPNIFKYVNQNSSDSMDHILAKTVSGISDFVREILPDLLKLSPVVITTPPEAPAFAFPVLTPMEPDSLKESADET